MQHDISFATDFEFVGNFFPEAEVDTDFLTGFSSIEDADKDCGKQPVIFLNPVGLKSAWRFMGWGCMPFDLSDAPKSSKQWPFMLYTPAERIFGDPKSYWHRIRDQRCLIPASGIYVQRTMKNLRSKVPYFVYILDQPVFLLPGLYSADEAIDVRTGERVVRWVFTIVNRPANKLLKHLRSGPEKDKTMPLLLPFSLSRHWLDHDLSEADYRAILEFEMPSEVLQAWPIYSTQSEAQRPDNKERNERFDWRNLPPFDKSGFQ